MSVFCRVITGVSGSPRNLQALRYAAVVARSQDATLIPVVAWVPPGGDAADRRHPSGYLRRIWVEDARARLHTALDAALGGLPDDVVTEPRVIRGEAGEVLVREASHPGDLLVIGTGRHGSVGRLLSAQVNRYCLAHACCPVLAIPPTALEIEAGHVLHRWAFRHSGLTFSELAADR
ncbi:MAG TPA: universal stress protein [Streptosporangiaceae bacterium]|nr:universal stress protein [Streptosporangiaceae bacterium]